MVRHSYNMRHCDISIVNKGLKKLEVGMNKEIKLKIPYCFTFKCLKCKTKIKLKEPPEDGVGTCEKENCYGLTLLDKVLISKIEI